MDIQLKRGALPVSHEQLRIYNAYQLGSVPRQYWRRPDEFAMLMLELERKMVDYTARQKLICRLRAEGFKDGEIARSMHCSRRTVQYEVRVLREEFERRWNEQAAALADNEPHGKQPGF